MELVQWVLDLFLHLDRHLAGVIKGYGTFAYLLLFAVVFLETGLVVTPILPGDSLLFAAGTFAAMGSLNVWVTFGLCSCAAVAGDTVNYWIGHYTGPKMFTRQESRLFKPEYLRRTHDFYEKYGGKTIVLARFIPIIRTFAPFVAGIGAMRYGRFLSYNVIGGILWPAICIFAGHYFGNISIVKNNFSLVILAIVFISLLPGIVEFLNRRAAGGKGAETPKSDTKPLQRPRWGL
jgi:membrane-associated protein